ncbi:hypothetical protein AOL_s00043g205 [Orbilia oligospora ATCC 24927]|uniref:F-box domain-containing protein n=1 Tax=Arthrobotrys oligospora (strain ATCC 24927 / CBS 115.81 / DSM 1491) TaxID=756982 RepID=G1X3D2_ARTOA|nr:hypothetical protein AOL_s00043g205 [Orbilia oligospora ATCC 24927]EGX52416.1 hypothetical protein AOL_s00043g205 [Orbilia oligospora ATCC 24927]
MASLNNLIATPEILNYIFQYLPKPDILRLALTCKALLPASLDSLWKNLKLFPEEQYPGPDRKSEKEFCKFVTKYGASSSGIQYTKKLDVGNCLNWDSLASRALLRLLESGSLQPGVIELHLYGSNAGKQLQHFKRYSESRSLVDFSVRLHATVALAKLADLHKITYLELHYNPPSFGVDFDLEVRSEPCAKATILGCAEVLRQTPKLTEFKWNNGYSIEGDNVIEFNMISDELKIFQDVFEGLERLRVLVISGCFFHPSFCLIPPRSLKKLVVTGLVSSAWWRKLAVCPLVGLETLELSTSDASRHPHLEDFPYLADELPIKNFRLEDVAVVSLKKFIFNGRDKTLNMYQSFVRRNPMIDPYTKRSALSEQAGKILQEGLELVLRELRKCKIAVINTYIKRFKEGHPPPDENGFMTEFSKLVLTNIAGDLPEQLYRLETSGMGIGNQCREQLQGYLEDSINETAGVYADFEEGKLDITEKKFMEDCIKKLMHRVKESEDYVFKAERFVTGPIEEFVVRMRKLQSAVIKDVLVDKLAAGHELTMGIVLDIWTQAVIDFEKHKEAIFCAGGYHMYSRSMSRTGFDPVYVSLYPSRNR